MNWTRSHGLLAGLGLVLLVNAAALGAAAWNRNGEPESRLTLSERELQRNSDWHQENSGISLRLLWRLPSDEPDAPWAPRITAETMQGLGFRVPTHIDRGSALLFDRQQARDALLVLELDGPLYQRELRLARQRLAQAEKALAAAPDNVHLKSERDFQRENLEHEENLASRLFLADAGTDLRALRARYPDRQHYAIVHGQVRPLSLYRNRAWVIGGNASTEGVRALNVPQRWHAELEGLAPRAERRAIEEAGEPFVAEVAFGQRLEPWIEQIQAQ